MNMVTCLLSAIVSEIDAGGEDAGHGDFQLTGGDVGVLAFQQVGEVPDGGVECGLQPGLGGFVGGGAAERSVFADAPLEKHAVPGEAEPHAFQLAALFPHVAAHGLVEKLLLLHHRRAAFGAAEAELGAGLGEFEPVPQAEACEPVEELLAGGFGECADFPFEGFEAVAGGWVGEFSHVRKGGRERRAGKGRELAHEKAPLTGEAIS